MYVYDVVMYYVQQVTLYLLLPDTWPLTFTLHTHTSLQYHYCKNVPGIHPFYLPTHSLLSLLTSTRACCHLWRLYTSVWFLTLYTFTIRVQTFQVFIFPTQILTYNNEHWSPLKIVTIRCVRKTVPHYLS